MNTLITLKKEIACIAKVFPNIVDRWSIFITGGGYFDNLTDLKQRKTLYQFQAFMFLYAKSMKIQCIDLLINSKNSFGPSLLLHVALPLKIFLKFWLGNTFTRDIYYIEYFFCLYPKGILIGKSLLTGLYLAVNIFCFCAFYCKVFN